MQTLRCKPGGVQTPANLGLQSVARAMQRCCPPHRILARKDPSNSLDRSHSFPPHQYLSSEMSIPNAHSLCKRRTPGTREGSWIKGLTVPTPYPGTVETGNGKTRMPIGFNRSQGLTVPGGKPGRRERLMCRERLTAIGSAATRPCQMSSHEHCFTARNRPIRNIQPLHQR